MNNKYKQLFTALAQATEITAERVMEYNKNKNDDQGYKTAEIMRNDYAKLYDNLKNENYKLTYADFSKLLVGAIITSKQMEDRIANEKLVLQGYKVDTIPKLQRIIDEVENNNDEKAYQLAEEIFQVIDEEK